MPSGLRVYNYFPAEFVPEHWRTRMGSQNTDRLRWSNLVLVASKGSENPSVLDQEHSDLANQVSSFIAPLCLQRIKMVDIPWRIEGSNVENHVDVRRTGNFTPIIWSEDMYHNPADTAVLSEADDIFRTIQNIGKQGTHKRLIRGLRMLMRAWMDREPMERMNYIVRSLDAVVYSDQGRGKAHFKERCQLFVGHSQPAEDFFESLYVRRSEVTHMHELTELFEASDQADRQARAIEIGGNNMEAEIVATELYRRIFTNPLLLKNFEEDSDIRHFWKQPLIDNQTIFGCVIDPKRIQQDSSDREEKHKDLLVDW